MHILISLTIKRKANCTKLAIYLQANFMFLDNIVSSKTLIVKMKSNYWVCGRRVASKYQFTIFNASSPTPLQRSDGWRQHCRNPSSSHPFLWRRQIPTRQQILGFFFVGSVSVSSCQTSSKVTPCKIISSAISPFLIWYIFFVSGHIAMCFLLLVSYLTMI